MELYIYNRRAGEMLVWDYNMGATVKKVYSV
jgi:hypothetical protein